MKHTLHITERSLLPIIILGTIFSVYLIFYIELVSQIHCQGGEGRVCMGVSGEWVQAKRKGAKSVCSQ
jgi:hypothetical protein